MRRSTINSFRRIYRREYATRSPIIRIDNGTFYRHHPDSLLGSSKNNPPLFQNLHFTLESFATIPKFWAIIGPSSAGKTTFLQFLRGKHLCIPPTARSFPYLKSKEIEEKDPRLRNITTAIQYVGFDGEQGIGSAAPQTAYLSARYESRREDTDWSVRDYLLGNTELNPSQNIDGHEVSTDSLKKVVSDLRLEDLVDMPVSNLSNGQTRRARIAKALLGSPEVLLLDEPFMGLDPPTLLRLSPLLERLAKANAPRLVLSLRPQDPIPDWITHLMFLKGSCQIGSVGPKDDLLREIHQTVERIQQGTIESNADFPLHSMKEVGRILTKDGIVEREVYLETQTTESAEKDAPLSRDGYQIRDISTRTIGEPLVEMEGAVVAYKSKAVLGKWKQDVDGTSKDGLWWNIRRGERWGIFGPNGSGKTTILSLICSDHPQTYSLPIKLFGRSRKPEQGQRGVSIFEIQNRIGHSSPEIHNHIPRDLSLRQILENAWSETFRGRPQMDQNAEERVESCLRWFEQDLRPNTSRSASKPGQTTWADDLRFGGLPFSSQRVALFLRATIKNPDLVILDEAFSGMDDGVRDRCLLFLAHGETKQLSEDGHGNTRIVESEISKAGNAKLTGLNESQALLCISHVREEIPGSIREWICLPEANTGEPARFGRLDGPIEGDYRRWNEIWGM